MKCLYLFLYLSYKLYFFDLTVLSVNQATQKGIMEEKTKDNLIPKELKFEIQQNDNNNQLKQPDFLKKKEIVNIFTTNNRTPLIKITQIDTQIVIKKDKNEGAITEKVKFELKDGMFNSVLRKISLGGTSDRHFSFRLSSLDVKLVGAKVIDECFESTSLYEHPYICVIANFQSVDATIESKFIEIEYEYSSENLVRRREKPFSNKEQENVIVWIYDNYKRDSAIDKINLKINFENEINLQKIVAYPEKFLIKEHSASGSTMNSAGNLQNFSTIINWSVRDLKPNSYKNFALNIPIFNHSCKGMNEVHLEITTYSIIQFFIWLTIAMIIIVIIFYIYVDKKVKENPDSSFNETLKTRTNSSSNENIDNSNNVIK